MSTQLLTYNLLGSKSYFSYLIYDEAVNCMGTLKTNFNQLNLIRIKFIKIVSIRQNKFSVKNFY